MNKPKFRYEGNQIVFFFTWRGVTVELLRARLQVASFDEIKRLRGIAEEQLRALEIQLKAVA